MRRMGWWMAAVACAGLALGATAPVAADEGGGYDQTNLVANWDAYNAKIVEPDLQNAWGISMRPAGEGGHFWVTALDRAEEGRRVLRPPREGDRGCRPLQ